MDNLDFDFHESRYAELFRADNTEERAYFDRQAKQMHILCVQDALGEEQLKTITFANSLKKTQAQYFAKFGVARRIGMLWYAFRELTAVVRVERESPLSADEVKAASRDLNTIYINIVGTIDNYAWCLLHEIGSDDLKALPRNRIGLFSRDFLLEPRFAELKACLVPYRSWISELRSRRDPSAHRIPLSVPPSILRPEEARVYQEIQQRINDAMVQRDFGRADQLLIEQERLGTFVPNFLHNPDEGLTPFFPTIPYDVAQLIRLSKLVRDFLLAALNLHE